MVLRRRSFSDEAWILVLPVRSEEGVDETDEQEGWVMRLDDERCCCIVNIPYVGVEADAW